MVVAATVVVLDAAHIGTSGLFLDHVVLVLESLLKLECWEHRSEGPGLGHIIGSSLVVVLQS